MGFQRLATAISVTCIALLGACTMGDYGCATCVTIREVAYDVSPDSARILVGDSVKYVSWSCGGAFCEDHAFVVSDWSITDGAVALRPGGSAATVSRETTIFVRGTAAGGSHITGRSAADSTLTRTAHLAVFDSSAVTMVDLSGVLGATVPLKMGTLRTIPVQLRLANGAPIRGGATGWSVSDTTIAMLSPTEIWNGLEHRNLVPKKPGAVEVRVSFRDVVGVVRFTVAAN